MTGNVTVVNHSVGANKAMGFKTSVVPVQQSMDKYTNGSLFRKERKQKKLYD